MFLELFTTILPYTATAVTLHSVYEIATGKASFQQPRKR